MKRKWIYLNNPFEIATRNSKAKMLYLANDHASRLEAAKDDPDILALYTPFLASTVAYRSLMAQWTSNKSQGKGKTNDWGDHLDEMAKVWIYEWEGKVFSVYPKHTPEAMAIFPNNKAPLITGRYDERILALEALVLTLANYPALAALKDEIGGKLEAVKAVRQQQKEQFGKIGLLRSKVEDHRKALADLLDDNLCALKIKYRKNLDMLDNFFDLGLLRKIVSDSDAFFQYAGAVEAGKTLMLPLPEKLAVSANSACTFTNQSGQADLHFFFAANGLATDAPAKVAAAPNESLEGTAAEAGWAPDTHYLIVKNLGTLTAEFELSVVAGNGNGG